LHQRLDKKEEKKRRRRAFRSEVPLPNPDMYIKFTTTVCTVASPINAAITTDSGFPYSDFSDDGTDAFANARSQRGVDSSEEDIADLPVGLRGRG